LTTIPYPTRTATYAYLVTGQTNENGSVYIGYDNRYRVSSFSDPFYYGISYNYDTAGNRTKLSLNGATYATYTYDAVNRLTSRSAPNGVTTSESYDDLDRLTSLTHATSTATLISNQYQYNDAHNISSWTNTSGTHAYGYDPVDRLTSATNSAQPNESYSFDGVGNRTASHLSASYSYQPFNKLRSTATATHSFDNNGNLLSKTGGAGTTSFSWSEENQLKQVTLPTGLTVSNKYDGLGRRIQRTTIGGANERYIYDGNDVLLDLNADWSVATTYLSDLGIGNKLRQTSATTGVSYYLTDHLGSTAGLTNANGSMVEQLTYDSFGNSASSTRTRYGYTGRERDPDTGLTYYRARFYDPQLGRFISEDPIGLRPAMNLFGYVENRALTFKDPFGEDLFGITGGGSGGAAVGGLAIMGTAGYMVGWNTNCDCDGETSMGGAGNVGISAGEYGYPLPQKNSAGLGATIGAGGGLFWSNAPNYADAETDQQIVAVLRAANSIVGLCLSIAEDGDVEVFLGVEDCRALVNSLNQALVSAS
jgi:RHS repeat-associated protein